MEVFVPVQLPSLEGDDGGILVVLIVGGQPWTFWAPVESVFLSSQPLVPNPPNSDYIGWVKGTVHSQSMGFTFVEVRNPHSCGLMLIPAKQDLLRENLDIKVSRRVEG